MNNDLLTIFRPGDRVRLRRTLTGPFGDAWLLPSNVEHAPGGAAT